MRTLLAVGIFGALTASGWAQTPSPAQLGITSTTVPEVLYILDSTRAWVAMGTVDPITHTFTPVGSGGGPPTGGCNQLDFSVACNSQYVGAGVP